MNEMAEILTMNGIAEVPIRNEMNTIQEASNETSLHLLP